MIQEQDIVVLTRDFGAHGLKEGDIGTVVHKYRGETLEVEFVTAEGRTIAVLTLTEGDIRALRSPPAGGCAVFYFFTSVICWENNL
jgi:hypothetical protein